MKTFVGYVPFEHQRAIHDYLTTIGPNAGAIVVVKSKRQIGKSMMIEQELLRHAINYSRSISICLSLTFSNCSKIFKELVDGIRDSGVIKTINNLAMEITFINGSTIIFKSAAQKDTLRGYTIKNGGILCIDEAAYISDEIFSIVSPWVNVFNANILMVSTPRIKQGFFYEYYKEGLEGSPNVKSFNVNDWDTSFLLSNDRLETYRKLMPANQFISEYLGEFVDDLGSVFNITKNIWYRASNNKWHSPIDVPDKIVIGIDWSAGKQGDYTAISGFNLQKEQILLHYDNRKTPNQQIDWISDLIHKFTPRQVVAIVCETNSIGNIYIDMLKQKLAGYNIVEFTTTNDTKRDIIENVIQLIENEDVKLIKDIEQYKEFSMYNVEITKSGKITYNGAFGSHDDLVMATAFALKQIRDLTKSTYSFSFGSGHQTQEKLRNKYR